MKLKTIFLVSFLFIFWVMSLAQNKGGRWKSMNTPNASHDSLIVSSLAVDSIYEASSSSGVTFKDSVTYRESVLYEADVYMNMGSNEKLELKDSDDDIVIVLDPNNSDGPKISIVDATGADSVYAYHNGTNFYWKNDGSLGTYNFDSDMTIAKATASSVTLTIDAIREAILELDKSVAGRYATITFKLDGSANWSFGTPDSDGYGDGEDFFICTGTPSNDPVLTIDDDTEAIAIGGTNYVSNAIAIGDKGTQYDLLVTRENVPAGTDSSFKITINTGQPEAQFKASDGDAFEITINTSDQAVFQNAGGGYSFDNKIVTDQEFIWQIDASDNITGDVITANEINPTGANADFHVSFSKVPSKIVGATVVLDSVRVLIKTTADAAYVDNIKIETDDHDGTGTTRVTYETDIGNGDQTLHTVNILASDYTMLHEQHYWLLIDVAGMTGADEVEFRGAFAYGHLE
jgi:hypothetical protein